MTILQTGLSNQDAVVPAGYQIERSLRFNSTDSAYLSWVPAQTGNRRTWTWSGWVKRSKLGTAQGIFVAYLDANNTSVIDFTTSDTLRVLNTVSGVTEANKITTAVYRDTSAFYHIHVACNGSTSLKIWVNGVEVTAFGTNTGPGTGNWMFNLNTVEHRIGREQYTTSNYYLDAMMADVHFIDGQALTPSDFGETDATTGVWVPKAYTGSYGQNGFYLPFNDNSTDLNLGRNRQTLTADPYWNQTTLLLNGNQPSGVTDTNNNVFKDSSSNNFTITRNGGAPGMTQGTFSPFSQSGLSGYFNGATTSGPLVYASYSTTNFDWFTSGQDFTLECWVFPVDLATFSYSDGGNTVPRMTGNNDQNGTSNYWTFGPISDGRVRFHYFNGAVVQVTSTATVTANTWNHIAFTKTSSGITIFVNGTATTATAISSTPQSSATYPLTIGRGNSASINGYVSNYRILKNVTPPYSGTYTVPTAPLTDISGTKILTMQANRFVDSSSVANAMTVTGSTVSIQPFSPFTPTAAYSAATNGGSGYFDGTGDYLTAPSNSVWNLNTTPWTLEFWVYPTASGTQWWGQRASTSNFAPLKVGLSGTTLYLYGSSNNSSWNISLTGGSGTVRLNAWNHIVVQHDGTNFTAYVNGTREINTANAAPYSSTAAQAIGATTTAGDEAFSGYMGSVRLIKGQVLYTGTSITVPNAPLTTTGYGSTSQSITGTVGLLMNFTNAGIIDSTGDNVLETVGNAQISTTQSKFGGSSMYFDGTGDYLSIPNNSLQGWRRGDYTIEFWINTTSSTRYATIITRALNTTSWEFTLMINNASTTSGDVTLYDGGYSTSTPLLTTTGVNIRDGSWHHVALVRNGNNFYIFVDGTQRANATQTFTPSILTVPTLIGNDTVFTSRDFGGYLDDFRITTGYARYTGNFTPPTAQFAYNTADINVKQWVPTNLSVTAGTGNDSLVDSPTNYGTDTGAGGEVRGNYATLNPLRATATLANGNLQFTGPTTGGAQGTFATMGVTSGKWYFEVTPTTVAGTYYPSIGISTNNDLPTVQPGVSAGGYMYMANGQKFVNNALSTYGASYAANDTIGVALDMDAGTITFYKNGVSQGQAYTGVTGTATPVLGNTGAATPSAGFINFGQRPFAYTAPNGFKALCTANLPTPAIVKSNTNFNVVTYTGNGTTTGNTQAITGLGFQPDFVWIKSRSSGTQANVLNDTVRGANKLVFSNVTDAEATVTNVLNSFDSDGFTVAYNSSYTAARTNENAVTYVGWAWKSGDSNVSNTNGTITSTVRANTTAGISIVTYTGNGTADASIGHGLGVAPKLILVKRRDAAAGFINYFTFLDGSLDFIPFDSTSTKSDSAQSVPTSSVFYVSNSTNVNASTGTYVAYCFAEISGFSKFGSYTGNASSTNGPFLYCGFRPRFIMFRRTDVADSWTIFDTARNTSNVADLALYPSGTTAQTTETNNPFDILSNGFKVRGAGTTSNASNGSYIFAAFAEAPFNYARAR